MALKTKGDLRKEGWETSEFPIVCETCLGDNPYVRMTKAEFDKECKICARPFTVFRWKPGSNARFKKTEVCQTCAKLKNVCQTCLLDLEYGLPVQVRDAAFPSGAQPVSDVNREWFANQAERQIEYGQLSYGKAELKSQLEKVARHAPYYKRNVAHICSFFVKGECKRGTTCPYRHELPSDDPELANQNIKDRYYGKNDPVAKKILAKIDSNSVEEPRDPNIKTLFIGGVTEDITEQDLRDVLYSFGEITEAKIVRPNSAAFISYSTREAAQSAVTQLHKNLVIKGHKLRIAWQRPQAVDRSQNPTNPTPSYPDPSASTASLTAQPPPPNPNAQPFVYPAMNSSQFGSKRDR